ncbi:MAG: efflux RND transporter periplasmic adaptor subunit [Candidatus Pacebacteria bacterium]|nr:efflux RND transporter periplasmic adaptor subunit [Candidatus Paceibacterota bacterium]
MFFKSKKFWIIGGIILTIIVIFAVSISQNKGPQHEIVKVERGDLVQTVDAVGRVQSENKVSLYFEASGVIDRIYVVEGEEVKKGDVLAKLNLENLNSYVKQAEANLNQKLAGVSDEQIDISLKQIDSATITYEKAVLNLENTKNLAEENLNNRYLSMIDLLDDSYIKLFNALKFAQELKETYFSDLSFEAINVRQEIEFNMADPIEIANNSLIKAKSTRSIDDIDIAINDVDSSLESSLDVLLLLKNLSESVRYKNVVSSTDKASLDQNKLVISTAQISLTSAQNEISLLKMQNENSIKAAELSKEEAGVSLDLQKANYNLLIAAPRDVDLAYLESVLSQAISNRDKAIIKSPIDGVITSLNKKEGELISSAEPLVEVLSPKYQIEVNIPETDITKISLKDKAEIELDAIDNKVFESEVTSINPAATTIQDVVYYKVVLSILTDDDQIKPGMTADILIYTDERLGALYLPSRSILSEGDKKYVRVLDEQGEIIEKDVEVGLNADDSKKEILGGVEEGEEIILKIAK